MYFVCHEPAVIVKHSENLTEFIQHVDEFGLKGPDSNLNIIHEQTVYDLWNMKDQMIEANPGDHDFGSLKADLPEHFVVADLRDKPIKAGFTWALAGPNTTIIRPTDEPLWIIEKQVKQGFFSRLFGKKK